MVTTFPVERSRCPLCLAILEIARVTDGTVARLEFTHSDETCRTVTLQRLKALEEQVLSLGHRERDSELTIDRLGQYVGVAAAILAGGRRWLEHRKQRSEDLRRLRQAFGTSERNLHNPLWAAEEEVAGAIQHAIDFVEKEGKA